LFVSNACICLVFVDDTLCPLSDCDRTEAFGDGFGRRDDVAGFLGVLIRGDPGANTTIELLQTDLIQRIVDARQISHLQPKRTTSKLGVFSTDPEGDPPNCTLSYASVFGMINLRTSQLSS
jgi:hypothetical protein